MSRTLYQALTQPVSTQPETVQESKWHQPWSEPVRTTRAALAIALIVSGFVGPTFVPPAPDATSYNWFSHWSEPVRTKAGLRPSLQQTVAFVKAAPFAETVTEDRWHAAWSEPVRIKIGLRPELQQILAFVKAAPFAEGVLESKWHQAWSEPVRVVSAQQQLTTVTDLYPVPSPLVASEFNSTTIYSPYRLIYQATAYPVNFSIPVKPDYLPWAEPVRTKAGLRSSLQQTVAFVQAAPFAEGVLESKWHQAWSEPVRVKPRLATTQQQALFYNPNTPAVVSEDKWHQAWSEPVRVKPALRTALQQTLAFVKAAPFPETTLESKWHFPWSEPVRVRPALRAALQRYEAFYPFPYPPIFYTMTMAVTERGDTFEGRLFRSTAATDANVDIHEFDPDDRGNTDLVEEGHIYANVTIIEV